MSLPAPLMTLRFATRADALTAAQLESWLANNKGKFRLVERHCVRRKDIYARANLPELSLGGNPAKKAKKIVDRFFRKNFCVQAAALGGGYEGYRGVMMIDE
jgi:hypothetical protein